MKNIAIFIDCENVSAKYVGAIFDEAKKRGRIMIAKAFRDWSKANCWDKDIVCQTRQI